ncbi:hypothetical protein BSL78_20643 [Apostichopus japonicus]|uniref:Uncharacterized protein n=1 Tax=Stichopus japonicus TaxID=307972 RepID=A0A2G8K3E1_STIJA|nr:hypothetical protein BSL78_20643 [Apostichopus japonicus]
MVPEEQSAENTNPDSPPVSWLSVASILCSFSHLNRGECHIGPGSVSTEGSVILVLASQQRTVSYWSWHLNRGQCHIGPSISTEDSVILVLASQQRAVSYWS